MKSEDIPKTEARKGSKKAIALLVLVFLLGAITGIGGSIMVTVHRLKENMRHPELSQGPANRMIARIGKDLEKQLDLTAEESDAVREELAASRVQLHEIRVQLLQDVRSVAVETVDRIASRLPEAKRKPLRELTNERLEPWGLQPDP